MSRSGRRGLGAAAAVLRSDGAKVLREPMIAVLPAAPFLAGAAFRFILPVVLGAAEKYFGFNSADWHWLIGAFLVQFPPMFYGMIAGFMLLEEREERVLQAVSVTPFGKVRYLAVRLGAASVLSAIASLAMLPLVGLPRPGFAALILPAAASGLLAPVYALLMAGFAENRIEGLAVGKLLGLVNLIPLAVLLPYPLRAAAWPLAPYWITEAYRMAAIAVPEAAFPPSGYVLSIGAAFLGASAGIGLLTAVFRSRLE